MVLHWHKKKKDLSGCPLNTFQASLVKKHLVMRKYFYPLPKKTKYIYYLLDRTLLYPICFFGHPHLSPTCHFSATGVDVGWYQDPPPPK